MNEGWGGARRRRCAGRWRWRGAKEERGVSRVLGRRGREVVGRNVSVGRRAAWGEDGGNVGCSKRDGSAGMSRPAWWARFLRAARPEVGLHLGSRS